MKVHQLIFTTGFFLLLLLVSGCQKDEAVVPPAVELNPALVSRYVPGPGTSECLLPDCETAIDNARAALIEMAEEECGIFLSAIRCCEANQEVFLMYRISSDCEIGTVAPAPVTGPDNGYPSLVPGPVGVEFLESTCINGGTSLRIVLKGGVLPLPLGPFEVHWWVDYEYMGNDTQIDCVSGEEAQLLIIDHWNDNAKQWYKFELHETEPVFRY